MSDFLTGPAGPPLAPTTPTFPTVPSAGPASDTASPDPAPARRRRLLLPAVAAVVAVAALGGVGYTMTRPPAKETINGTFTLIDSDVRYNSIGGSSSNCYGKGGYDDIDAGTQVVVRDGDGKLLATSRFGTGTAESTSGLIHACEFPFTVDVPSGKAFYSISVGSSSGLEDGRGQMTYSAGDLEEKQWKVDLSLGD